MPNETNDDCISINSITVNNMQKTEPVLTLISGEGKQTDTTGAGFVNYHKPGS